MAPTNTSSLLRRILIVTICLATVLGSVAFYMFKYQPRLSLRVLKRAGLRAMPFPSGTCHTLRARFDSFAHRILVLICCKGCSCQSFQVGIMLLLNAFFASRLVHFVVGRPQNIDRSESLLVLHNAQVTFVDGLVDIALPHTTSDEFYKTVKNCAPGWLTHVCCLRHCVCNIKSEFV